MIYCLAPIVDEVEVEGRLQALETAVAALQAHSHEAPCDTGVGGDLEAAVKALVRPEALAPSADDLDQ